MGMLKKIASFFTTHHETRENHSDQELQSRYYKAGQKKVMETVLDILRKEGGFEISSISEERGEISVNIHRGRKAFMVITVISVRPFETAVDLTVTTETMLPMDFGFSRKVILEFYEKLNQLIPYIGTNSFES